MVTDAGGEFRTTLAHRAVWRLLVKGLGAFLPERAAALSLDMVRPVPAPPVAGLPVYLTRDYGFGLHLRGRSDSGYEPEREIFVRGREGQSIGSIGIVIVGSSPAIGTRIIDARRLFRYARALTFETLYDPADAGSVLAAIQATRAVENIVFLDLALGVGLGAELDQATGMVTCPLLVQFGPRSSVTIDAHVPELPEAPAQAKGA